MDILENSHSCFSFRVYKSMILIGAHAQSYSENLLAPSNFEREAVPEISHHFSAISHHFSVARSCFGYFSPLFNFTAKIDLNESKIIDFSTRIKVVLLYFWE